MTPTPYGTPAEHLHDHLRLARLALRAAVRRRQLGDPAHFADDGELAGLRAELADGLALVDARAAASAPATVPLRRLQAVFGLSPTELQVLVLLIGLELDLRLRAQVRALMNDGQRQHPDVGLLAELLYTTPARARASPRSWGPTARWCGTG
ncbi:MAG: hypothetical protein IPL61_29190 [Myxococcales bacterium]|nr:hypothetical protein [Myxococcales bacterium]